MGVGAFPSLRFARRSGLRGGLRMLGTLMARVNDHRVNDDRRTAVAWGYGRTVHGGIPISICIWSRLIAPA
jgi:hypothetical protein